jgi:hypothetical protein
VSSAISRVAAISDVNFSTSATVSRYSNDAAFARSATLALNSVGGSDLAVM